MARLSITRPGEQERVETINSGQVTIGRGAGSDIVLNDQLLSRTHCRLTRVDNDYEVTDLGSSNGTAVNGERLSDAKTLMTGDIIRIGNTKVLYLSDSAAEEDDEYEDGQTVMINLDDSEVISEAESKYEQRIRFVLQYPKGDGKKLLPLAKEPVTIGRHKSCSLILTEKSVSQCHARIEFDKGQYIIHDLGATNGVLVNGVQVKSAVLRPGTRLRIGRVPVGFKELAHPPLPDAENEPEPMADSGSRETIAIRKDPDSAPQPVSQQDNQKPESVNSDLADESDIAPKETLQLVAPAPPIAEVPAVSDDKPAEEQFEPEIKTERPQRKHSSGMDISSPWNARASDETAYYDAPVPLSVRMPHEKIPDTPPPSLDDMADASAPEFPEWVIEDDESSVGGPSPDSDIIARSKAEGGSNKVKWAIRIIALIVLLAGSAIILLYPASSQTMQPPSDQPMPPAGQAKPAPNTSGSDKTPTTTQQQSDKQKQNDFTADDVF